MDLQSIAFDHSATFPLNDTTFFEIQIIFMAQARAKIQPETLVLKIKIKELRKNRSKRNKKKYQVCCYSNQIKSKII